SPISFTNNSKNELIKIYEVKLTDLNNTKEKAGTVVLPTSGKKGLFVQTGYGIIEITKLLFANGKIIDGKSAINGNKLKLGDKLGK
ncbi:MAG: hypothetical protein RR334_03915, partial [Clostridia bacterium]